MRVGFGSQAGDESGESWIVTDGLTQQNEPSIADPDISILFSFEGWLERMREGMDETSTTSETQIGHAVIDHIQQLRRKRLETRELKSRN